MFKRNWTKIYTLLAALLVSTLLLSACGGSSSGGSTNPPTQPPAPPTVAELNDASRLAAQATFGMSFAEIESIARQGKENWVDSQFNVPMSDHGSVVADLVRRRNAGEFAPYEQGIEFLTYFRRLAWWHQTVTAGCQQDDRSRRVSGDQADGAV